MLSVVCGRQRDRAECCLWQEEGQCCCSPVDQAPVRPVAYSNNVCVPVSVVSCCCCVSLSVLSQTDTGGQRSASWPPLTECSCCNKQHWTQKTLELSPAEIAG